MTESNKPDGSLVQAEASLRTGSQTTQNTPAAADQVSDQKTELVESLEWLLGSEDAIFASEEEKEERRERRKDLLLWLLHQPRLAPYGEPQPG